MSTGGRAWFSWPASGRPREPNKEEFEKVHDLKLPRVPILSWLSLRGLWCVSPAS